MSIDDFDLDANLSARADAFAGSSDQQLRCIPTLLLLTQCLSSSQGLTDAVRHPHLEPTQVADALRAFEMGEAAEAYLKAAQVAPPAKIHSDDIDIKQWPNKERYLALRGDFEQQSGEITRRVYELARQRWAEISTLPADSQVLSQFKALRKRLRLR